MSKLFGKWTIERPIPLRNYFWLILGVFVLGGSILKGDMEGIFAGIFSIGLGLFGIGPMIVLVLSLTMLSYPGRTLFGNWIEADKTVLADTGEAQEKIYKASLLTFNEPVRLEVRRDTGVRIYVSNTKAMIMAKPEGAITAHIAKAWCEDQGINLWFLPRVVIRDIQTGANLASYSCYFNAAEIKSAKEVKIETALAGSVPGVKEEMVFVKQENGGFHMDNTEVTQAAYQRIMGSNPSAFKDCPACPVENVNWDKAKAYCKSVGKRLPTEAEWEFASASGGNKEEYAGTNNESELGDYAWYKDNSGGLYNKETHPHPVGGKKPNSMGLYDMSGNVWEWTDTEIFKTVKTSSQKHRVTRGGSYDGFARHVRTALQGYALPSQSYNDVGFRCVR